MQIKILQFIYFEKAFARRGEKKKKRVGESFFSFLRRGEFFQPTSNLKLAHLSRELSHVFDSFSSSLSYFTLYMRRRRRLPLAFILPLPQLCSQKLKYRFSRMLERNYFAFAVFRFFSLIHSAFMEIDSRSRAVIVLRARVFAGGEYHTFIIRESENFSPPVSL